MKLCRRLRTESAMVAEISGSWSVTSMVMTLVFLSTVQLMLLPMLCAMLYCILVRRNGSTWLSSVGAPLSSDFIFSTREASHMAGRLYQALRVWFFR